VTFGTALSLLSWPENWTRPFQYGKYLSKTADAIEI